MLRLVPAILIFLLMPLAHAEEPSAEPDGGGAAAEESPKRTPGGFIELEIEEDNDKTAGDQASDSEGGDDSSGAESGVQ